MLIAPVVNNSGKKGCGVLWRHKYYGKYAARPRRMREGKAGAGGTKKGRIEETEMADGGKKEDDVKAEG